MVRNNMEFIDNENDLVGKTIKNIDTLKHFKKGLYKVIVFENDEIAIFNNELQIISEMQFKYEKKHFDPIELADLSLMDEQKSKEINFCKRISDVYIDILDKEEKKFLLTYLQKHLNDKE